MYTFTMSCQAEDKIWSSTSDKIVQLSMQAPIHSNNMVIS